MKLLMKLLIAVALVWGILLFADTNVLLAQVLKMPERALGEQFPGATVERKAVYLTHEQKDTMDKTLGFPTEGRMHTFYVARGPSGVAGYGIFDTHKIRTKEETIFVVISREGRVKHVEVISFFEPHDYLAPERWLALLENKSAADSILPGRDLPVITGATLTTNAVTHAVRKILYLQKLHFGGAL